MTRMVISKNNARTSLAVSLLNVIYIPHSPDIIQIKIQLCIVRVLLSQRFALNGCNMAMYLSKLMTKIVRNDASILVQNSENDAFVTVSESKNDFFIPQREELSAVKRSAMATLATR